jgi:hypothetical protein
MKRRTPIDFAQCMRPITQTYPDDSVIRIVLDNPNTYKIASLYEAFPPEKARAIARCLKFHYTPRHGRWLNNRRNRIRCPVQHGAVSTHPR